MFEVEGGKVGIATGWQHGPTVDKGDRWDAAELGAVVDGLLAEAPSPRRCTARADDAQSPKRTSGPASPPAPTTARRSR